MKARLLHIEKSVGPEQGVLGEISPTTFRKRVVWYRNRSLVRSCRALKIGPGGVLFCVTYYCTSLMPDDAG